MPPKPKSRGQDNVSIGILQQALRSLNVVTFRYANLERKCEPHVIGITNGRQQLLCWQLAGESQRGGIPEWRRFDIKGIQNYIVTEEQFPGYRPVPYPHSKWDQIISTV